MKQTKLSFRDLLTRYLRYSRKLARVWDNKQRREFFQRKMEQLQARMADMKRASRTAVAGAVLATGMLMATNADAQQFFSLGQNPLGLSALSYGNRPEFADLDGDGDLDVLAAESYGTFSYFENTGTATSPAFAAPLATPFGLPANAGYSAVPALVDIDNDGDLDLFVAGYYGDITYYENTGTAIAPQFAAGSTFPTLAGTGSYYSYGLAIEFADMDDDGDFDVLVSQSYTTGGYYFQNNGTASAASFAAPIPSSTFGININSYYVSPAAADIDGDGDFDLFGFDSDGLTFYENTGNATTASFATPVLQPFGVDISGFNRPVGTIVDLNADGKLDIAFGAGNGDFFVYYGHGITASVDATTRVCADNAVSITLEADDTDGGSLTVSATSANQSILPNANVTVSGTQPNFTISVAAPAASGGQSTVVTLAISNGAVTITKAFRVVIENQPNFSLSTTACAGDSLTLAAPEELVWYSAASGGNLLATTDSFSTGVLSQSQTYYVASIDSAFRIDSVDASFSAFADFDSVGGDNRTGIAVTSNYVYFNGDDEIVRYAVNMSSFITLPQQDGFFSDLATGQLYSLWNATGNSAPVGTTLDSFLVDEFALLDDNLDTVSFITLSSPILMGGDYQDPQSAGIYAGEGFVALYSGFADSSLYVVELPSGQVTNLGRLDFQDRAPAENWASWGFATRSKGGDVHLYTFNADADKIVRLGVSDNLQEVVYDFGEDLTDANVAYSPWLDRLYIDWEGNASFFPGSESGGFIGVASSYLRIEGACREEVTVTVADIAFTGVVVDEVDNDGTGSISLDSIDGGAAPYVGEWSNGESGVTSVSGLSAGTYTVTVTDANGCTATESFVVDNLVGITEVQNLVANVYPNPTTGQFYVELGQVGDVQVNVTDLTGRTVATAQGNGASRIALDLGNASSGIYYVRVQQGNAIAVKKLVVE